jgi:hypothetical protein
MMYPPSEYDGTFKSKDWSSLPQTPSQGGGDEEVKWVVPEKFFDELSAALADAPPLPRGGTLRAGSRRPRSDEKQPRPRRR